MRRLTVVLLTATVIAVRASGLVIFFPFGLFCLPRVASSSLVAVANTCGAGNLAAMDLIGQERCEHVFQGVLLLSLVRFAVVAPCGMLPVVILPCRSVLCFCEVAALPQR